MVITHAQFLNDELANPLRAFVNLAPQDGTVPQNFLLQSVDGIATTFFHPSYSYLRCEIAIQAFSHTQPLQPNAKPIIVFSTVESSDRIWNDVPTVDQFENALYGCTNDSLATPAGFAFAIQQLRAMNASDALNETIYIPCFPNEGHSFGIPDDQFNHWNPNPYAEAVEYARTL
nr:putative coat protein [Ipomoea batatas]